MLELIERVTHLHHCCADNHPQNIKRGTGTIAVGIDEEVRGKQNANSCGYRFSAVSAVFGIAGSDW